MSLIKSAHEWSLYKLPYTKEKWHINTGMFPNTPWWNIDLEESYVYFSSKFSSIWSYEQNFQKNLKRNIHTFPNKFVFCRKKLAKHERSYGVIHSRQDLSWYFWRTHFPLTCSSFHSFFGPIVDSQVFNSRCPYFKKTIESNFL